jgi:radical SAM protein with 4Fe4S-binding SPASM domain
MDKVGLARSDGVVVIPGMVPSTQELGREAQIIDWFVNHNFEAFNIERYNSFGGTSPGCPDNLSHSTFLIAVFDYLMKLESGSQAPRVRVIQAAILGVLFGQPGDRWGGSCQSDFVVVEPDGSLNSCPDKSSHEKPYSNVSDGYYGFASSLDRRRWVRIQTVGHRNQHCSSCQFSTWCRSGCPITTNVVDRKSDECSGYRRFLEHVKGYCSTQTGRNTATGYLKFSNVGQAATCAT